MILHSFKVYSSAFPPTTTSAVVKWAKDRVDNFNASLRRQMLPVARNSELWTQCANIVTSRAAVLAEVGVDFTSLVARGLEGEDEGVAGLEEVKTEEKPRMPRKKSVGSASRSRERERRRDKDRDRDSEKGVSREASVERSRERRPKGPR